MENIIKALIKVQGSLGKVKKDSKNTYLNYNYADINSILRACKQVLTENNLLLTQSHCSDEFGSYVETKLYHESGEKISSKTKIVLSKTNDCQAQGSGITYARRYGIQSLLSLEAEDDDGQKAVVKNEQPSKMPDNDGYPKEVYGICPLCSSFLCKAKSGKSVYCAGAWFDKNECPFGTGEHLNLKWFNKEKHVLLPAELRYGQDAIKKAMEFYSSLGMNKDISDLPLMEG